MYKWYSFIKSLKIGSNDESSIFFAAKGGFLNLRLYSSWRWGKSVVQSKSFVFSFCLSSCIFLSLPTSNRWVPLRLINFSNSSLSPNWGSVLACRNILSNNRKILNPETKTQKQLKLPPSCILSLFHTTRSELPLSQKIFPGIAANNSHPGENTRRSLKIKLNSKEAFLFNLKIFKNQIWIFLIFAGFLNCMAGASTVVNFSAREKDLIYLFNLFLCSLKIWWSLSLGKYL